MKIGLLGLGKMGTQILQLLLAHKHSVVVDAHSHAATEAKKLGAEVAKDKTELVKQLSKPAVIWLMVPSDAVDNEISQLVQLLPKGSIIVDGGNSDYRLTVKRAEACSTKNLELVDAGVSGGVHGLKHGFSIMVGGSVKAFQTVEPIIKDLAQPDGYGHFGPAGTGHYVKMVHNGIEYGMMQSLAEGYRLLREGKYKHLDLAKVAKVWQHGSVVSSWLNGLNQHIFEANPDLDGIKGYVAESGEARWTLETAKELGIETPAIQAAFDVRLASQKGKTSFATKLLAAMRNAFGGHSINKQ